MTDIYKTNENVLKFFQSKKVMTTEELVAISKWSVPTVRRRMKGWHAYTSYNQNGRYYTLPAIPKFDQYGIWKYKKIFFSRKGNLKQTLINLVECSIAGRSAIESSNIIGISADTLLSHLYKNQQEIEREKHNGLYIYFSKNPDIYKKQKNKRERNLQNEAKETLPQDADSVIILAELIKHPKDTIEQLTRRARRKGINASIEMVRNLLVFLDLLKKTQDFQSFEH
jgi:hypothetical protein